MEQSHSHSPTVNTNNSSSTKQPSTTLIHPDISLLDTEIGSGSFAKVYLGKQLSTGKLLAIKAVDRSKLNRKVLDAVESEIRILRTVHHENIVHLEDIIVRFCFVLFNIKINIYI